MSDSGAPPPDHPLRPLYGCLLKMWRADKHFDALQDSIKEFLGSKPYEVVHDFQLEANHYAVQVKVHQRPPNEWSPIIGDIVHNTRSSLDHLAWQLVKRNAEEPIPGKTQFPIFSEDPFDRNAYPTTKKWKRAYDSWGRQTDGMHPRDIAFLKTLQPYYQRPEDPNSHDLARLRELSNWDKHRELHFATSAHVGSRYHLKEGTRNARIIPLYIRPAPRVFEDGTEVARFSVIPTGPNHHVDVYVKVLFDVAFGEGSPLEGLGIKRTLADMVLCVSYILSEFKIKFAGQMF